MPNYARPPIYVQNRLQPEWEMVVKIFHTKQQVTEHIEIIRVKYNDQPIYEKHEYPLYGKDGEYKGQYIHTRKVYQSVGDISVADRDTWEREVAWRIRAMRPSEQYKKFMETKSEKPQYQQGLIAKRQQEQQEYKQAYEAIEKAHIGQELSAALLHLKQLKQRKF